MNYKLATTAALMALILGGCHFHRHHEAWQDAQPAQPLEIPQGLDRPGTSAELVVPATSASVEGEVKAEDRLPPTSLTLEVKPDVDTTWRKIGATLDAAGVGTILSRDADQHVYGISVKGTELNLPKQGFFHRLIHRAPDIARSYYTTVTVANENGQTEVHLDGDGPAVTRVNELLQGKLE
jgi:uncharacterized lipoprotein